MDGSQLEIGRFYIVTYTPCLVTNASRLRGNEWGTTNTWATQPEPEQRHNQGVKVMTPDLPHRLRQLHACTCRGHALLDTKTKTQLMASSGLYKMPSHQTKISTVGPTCPFTSPSAALPETALLSSLRLRLPCSQRPLHRDWARAVLPPRAKSG